MSRQFLKARSLGAGGGGQPAGPSWRRPGHRAGRTTRHGARLSGQTGKGIGEAARHPLPRAQAPRPALGSWEGPRGQGLKRHNADEGSEAQRGAEHARGPQQGRGPAITGTPSPSPRPLPSSPHTRPLGAGQPGDTANFLRKHGASTAAPQEGGINGKQVPSVPGGPALPTRVPGGRGCGASVSSSVVTPHPTSNPLWVLAAGFSPARTIVGPGATDKPAPGGAGAGGRGLGGQVGRLAAALFNKITDAGVACVITQHQDIVGEDGP